MTKDECDDFYGKTAAEWLRRWDAGDTCWTIEMGGLGPGYEQCIHVTAAEILRHMIASDYDPAKWEDKDEWAKVREQIDAFSHSNQTIDKLGLSGAQWGAAMNVACNFYRRGPAASLSDDAVSDRRIQVSRNFP